MYVLVAWELYPNVTLLSLSLIHNCKRSRLHDATPPLGLSPVYTGERGYWTDSEHYSSNYFSVLGFNTRYHEYKQRVNEVHGTFAAGQSESHWTITANNSPVFNPTYGFKILPNITDSIFGVNWNGAPSTDPFKCFYSFNVTKVSDMEAIGIPSV